MGPGNSGAGNVGSHLFKQNTFKKNVPTNNNLLRKGQIISCFLLILFLVNQIYWGFLLKTEFVTQILKGKAVNLTKTLEPVDETAD